MLKETPYLSKILEDSESNPVLIFKYSSTCGTSSILKERLEKAVVNKEVENTIYLVTVQDMPVLSKKIEEFFNITHESPQIIIVNKGLVTYFASHDEIRVEKFINTK